jgi:hypothetical protein
MLAQKIFIAYTGKVFKKRKFNYVLQESNCAKPISQKLVFFESNFLGPEAEYERRCGFWT